MNIGHFCTVGHITTKELGLKIGYSSRNYLDYLALLNAIPLEWRASINEPSPCLPFDDRSAHTNKHLEIATHELFKLPNKQLRSHIVKQRHCDITGVCFWKRKYNVDVTPFFKSGYEACKESRLRLLNFKILHNIYPTNILLNKMKIKRTPLCEICKEMDFVEKNLFLLPKTHRALGTCFQLYTGKKLYIQ